jgi:hypothetical protein
MLSFVLEELLHQLAAFVFEDSTCDGAFGMQGMRSVNRKTAFFVTTAIDNAGYLAPA